MLDWNQYPEQLLKAIGDRGRLGPQTVRGCLVMGFTRRGRIASSCARA